jgi:putative DNA primase/helicase
MAKSNSKNSGETDDYINNGKAVHTKESKENMEQERDKKKQLVIAKLEDYISLKQVCSKCKKLKMLLTKQRKNTLPRDMWEKVIILLVSSGYIAHAKEFTRLSDETNTPGNFRFIDYISMGREYDEIIRCMDLGCDADNIAECFSKSSDSPSLDVSSWSPSFGKLNMTKSEKKRLGFIYTETKPNNTKSKNIDYRDAADYRAELEKEEDSETDGSEYDEQETSEEPISVKYNVFTKYLLLNFDILLHDSEEYYIYKDNFWQPISDKKLKRLLRRFFLKCESGWTPEIERRYMSTLNYDCWELSELKVEGARNYINLMNGLLNINNFKLRAHNKFIFSTIQIPTEYIEPEEGEKFNPEIVCPVFFNFLKTIFGEEDKTYESAEMVRYIQMLMGYCLSSSVAAHKMWFFLGEGSNGKSVLCDIMTELVGGIEKISSVPLEKFTNPFAVAQIKDKTMNISTENEVKKLTNTQLIKAITSGDPIQVEEKFKNPLTYRPTAKLIFSINTMPDIRDMSYGLGRRLDIVPFKIRFVKEPKAANEKKLVRNIKEQLLKEREGIFAFAIEGLKLLKKKKYYFPECAAVVSQRKKIGRSRSLCPDFIHAYITVEEEDDRVESNTKKGTPILKSKNKTQELTDDLFAAFIAWCLNYQHSNDAKNTDKGRFLREFRVALKENYGFRDKDSDKKKHFCENEGNSGSKAFFNCICLKDEAKEVIEQGREFIKKNNLSTRKEQNAKTAK